MLVVGLSLAAPPVAAQTALTPEQLTVRVERLTEISSRTENKLGAVQSQLKTLSEDMTRLSRLIDNRAMLEMIQLVDSLSDEISQLNGAIEQQGYDIDEIKKRQRELYLDIDRRLRDLESGATAAAPSQPITVPEVTPSVETPAAASQTAQTPAPAPTPEPVPASSQTTTASISPTPSVTQSEEKAAYQAAFDTLKEGRYKKAKTELKTFLTKFPSSSYAGNAQYWLGEAFYVTRDYDQGIVEFQKVLSTHPNSNKVPDAMLKLG